MPAYIGQIYKVYEKYYKQITCLRPAKYEKYEKCVSKSSFFTLTGFAWKNSYIFSSIFHLKAIHQTNSRPLIPNICHYFLSIYHISDFTEKKACNGEKNGRIAEHLIHSLQELGARNKKKRGEISSCSIPSLSYIVSRVPYLSFSFIMRQPWLVWRIHALYTYICLYFYEIH